MDRRSTKILLSTRTSVGGSVSHPARNNHPSLAGDQSSSPRPVPAELCFGEHLRLGVLTEAITPQAVDEVIERAGAREKRRRLPPARAVMYFVLALCLFSSADSAGPPGYRAVLRMLTEQLRHLPGWGMQKLPTSAAPTRARQRLGPGTEPSWTSPTRQGTALSCR
ncbi:transposase domain-containing protein [Streptomyces sp. GQFP]|uniref:transposase domain-containing protein n=1 Tax=Streptomyces sp. GQFP TaxID=2907545 RepID=UPI003FA6F631